MTPLSTALTIAKLALAKKPYIRHFMHFLLKPGSVTACDDRLGIRVQTQHTLNCCAPGTEFINAFTPESTLSQSGGSLIVQSTSSKVKLPTLPADDYPLLWPVPANDAPTILFGREFIDGLDMCLKGSGKDEDRPEFLGVTVVPGNPNCTLASTDNMTITAVTVKRTPATGAQPLRWAPFVLPDPFCRALVAATRGLDAPVLITVGESKVFAKIGDDIELFCSHFSVAAPWDFQGMLDTLVADTKGRQDGVLPDNWEDGLQQVATMLGPKVHLGAAFRETPEGFAVLAQRDNYSADVLMDFGGTPPPSGLKFDPKLLLRAPKSVVLLTFGSRMAFMTDDFEPEGAKPRVVYIVSASANGVTTASMKVDPMDDDVPF